MLFWYRSASSVLSQGNLQIGGTDSTGLLISNAHPNQENHHHDLMPLPELSDRYRALLGRLIRMPDVDFWVKINWFSFNSRFFEIFGNAFLSIFPEAKTRLNFRTAK